MKNNFITVALAGFLFTGLSANAQTFTTKYADERDHAHYAIENFKEDLFMGGTTYEAGSLVDTDIHAQRIDNSGNVMWEQRFDIGDEERCVDIALYYDELMVITGTTKIGGLNKIFVMTVSQSSGSLINKVILNPGPTSHIEQTPTEIIFSEKAKEFYLSGYTFDSSTTPFSTIGEGLLFSLNAVLGINWVKETPNEIVAIEEIDGVGVYVGSRTNSAVDYSGNLIWQINSGEHASGNIVDAEYDASRDRLFVLGHNSLIEITGASGGGAALNQMMTYNDDSRNFRNIQHLDLELNPITNELLLLQASEEYTVAYRNYHPCVINLDLNTLSINNAHVTRTYNPGAYYFDEDYRYAFGRSMQLSEWGSDFGVVYFEHPDFGAGAPNEYDLKILKTDAVGVSRLSCEEEIPMTYSRLDPVRQTATSFTTISYTTSNPSVVDISARHTVYENCFKFEPCALNIDHMNVEYTDCYAQNYSIVYTSNPGTIITDYTWTWGDGTTTTTTDPNTIHNFSNSSCFYTVCVTVNAIGTDGSICSDTHCQTVLMLNNEGCEPCGEGFERRGAIRGSENGLGQEMNLTISPNPSNGNFVIELKGEELNGQFVLLNSIGQVVYTSENIQGNYYATTIDGSLLEEGIYLLQFRSGEKIITKKVVKI